MACIESCILEFHTDEVREGTLNWEGENFGVLRLKLPKTKITTKPTLILFTIDATGSMNERRANISKIEIVKQSFRNIIRYLSKQNAPIYITVHSFNDTITEVIDVIQIDDSNVNNAIEKIDAIQADGTTNIELALTNAINALKNYKECYPEYQLAHIFMTDGHATTGCTNIDTLNDIVSECDYGHVFVGFGNDHNLSLLKRLSDNKRCYYQFINNFEDTSCVYGELMYPYLYPCIEKATLLIENGEIYNWKTNTWTVRLDEDVLVAESEKIYHIRKRMDADVIVDIYGIDMVSETQEDKLLEKVVELPHLLSMETNDIVKTDLTPYMFRQKTQELLFHCIQNVDERSSNREELRKLFDHIREYMRTENKLEDAFMKQLCDDLHITYITMNSCEYGMATLSRFTSQGRQQTNLYTPRANTEPQMDLGTPRRPRIVRQQTRPINLGPMNPGPLTIEIPEDEEQEFREIDRYQIEHTNTSCYSNETVLDTMTQILGEDTYDTVKI